VSHTVPSRKYVGLELYLRFRPWSACKN